MGNELDLLASTKSPVRDVLEAVVVEEPKAGAGLEALSLEECVALLRRHDVGRIGVILGDVPVILPIKYRFVETSGRTWIALRARSGGIIERGSMIVGFEIDGVDPVRRKGWSVLVRGTLHRVDPDAADFRKRFDPQPWLTVDRDAWLIVEPFSITGRRLTA
jgi:hypothetical protein